MAEAGASCGGKAIVNSSASSSKSSIRSTRSTRKANSTPYEPSSESTPLLARRDDEQPQYVEDRSCPSSTRSSRQSSPDRLPAKAAVRLTWPTLIALVTLSLATIAVLVLGFAAPSMVKKYVQEATVFEPTSLSIASFTESGVRARVEGSFILDATRVESQPVRLFGRLGTWIAREVESGESEVKVRLPEHGDVLVGIASVPPVKVNIRDGHMNHIDFLTDIRPGNVDGIRAIANEWLEGRLDMLHVNVLARVPLRSGVLSLGSQLISESVVFQGQNLPGFPEFNVTKLNFHEVTRPGHHRSMAADVSVTISNHYAIKLTIPSLAFDILVPNCAPGDAYILVADASTRSVDIEPKQPVRISVSGLIRELPDALTTTCPGTNTSPLDILVANYIQGLETTIYVRGANPPSHSTPKWLDNLLRSFIVPLPFSGHALDHLVKNFSMTNVHFSLPDPFAEPGTPEALPKVSSLVKALIGLPKEMNFPVNISRVRSVADVYYRGKKLGYMGLKKWQRANTSRITEEPSGSPALLVEFKIKEAPLKVTDEDTFTDVIQSLMFKHKPVLLQVKAKVETEIHTALGQFVLRDIPATGHLTIKSPASGNVKDFMPRVESLKISQTTKSTVLLEARINFTNPTNYSAYIPYVDVKLLYNGTDVAHLTARELSVSPGLNSNIVIDASWNPQDMSGEKGVLAGRDLLSRYVSGLNTTVTVQSHEGTIPTLPQLGQALSALALDIPVPRIRFPGDDDQDSDRPHFIKDATLHLWSSTAVFTLLSPLPATTLFITSVDATAFYNHTEPVGRIDYKLPFAVPPGSSQTPRLPVDLSLGGAGYEALKNALGGTLKMDAIADVGVLLGEYSDMLFYRGEGIGAKVRI